MKRSLFALALALAAATPAAAQLGQLFSPGPLAKAHAHLEGADQCSKCHEQGKRVPASRCLACHKPIAERIAAKKGVHRDAGDDCVGCHVEHAGRDAELRPFDTTRFDHSVTGFLLDGKHAPLPCGRCHKTRSFLGLGSSCVSCHADPHKSRLGNDCARCHATAHPFKQAAETFDHAKTAFPLEGSHRAVACTKCHTGGRFETLKNATCATCHRNPHDAREVANGGHSRPPLFRSSPRSGDCASCHGTGTWKAVAFDHARTGTPLTGRHREVACAKCHTRAAAAARLDMRACASCHSDPHAGRFAQTCASCHDTNGFKGAPFDHAAKTRFALVGKHRSAACGACHKKSGDFRGLSAQCSSCHRDVHGGQLGASCEQCHTAESFRVASFTHPRFPEFFGGRHETLKCEQCHRGAVAARVYRSLSTECASCHKDVHAGRMPRCTDCHTVADVHFAPSRFDHARTAFPLMGKHAAVACAQCHAKTAGVAQYRGTATACASCHKDPHVGRLGTSCESCHTTGTFRVERYLHRKPGHFFSGKHASAACGDCHRKTADIAVRFSGLSECSSCHRDPHRSQFGPKCESCHQPDTPWTNASRAFHKAGRFPLEGRHLVVPCAECHVGGVLKGTPSTCYDCHWVRKQDDKYKTRLGTQCEACHRPTAWTAVTWDHASRTQFALTGSHRTLSCEQCHRGGEFGRALSDCASCHAADFDRTREPDHRAAGFPTTCQLCHASGAVSWSGAKFAHATFALAGTHATQSCASCHRNGVYAGTPRDCAGCHRADYDRAAEPAHAAAGFSLACETCHRFADARWTDGRYPHTLWPLLGRHTTARCGACHSGGSYAGRSSDCYSCHRPDYEKAASPSHVAASFPTTCLTCHKVADMTWSQGRFSHDTFALVGVHATQLCGACHRNNVFTGTARDCVGCHRHDFDATKAPNHLAAAFPTTCDACHRGTDPTWTQGKFDHAAFPLAGVHATRSCTDCHGSGVYRGTSRECSGCHQADYNAARNPSHVTAGFPTSCETCHKFTDTSWSQGVFNHSTFALAGVHASQPCASCHRNGVYRGTPRDCSGCHQGEYNATRSPSHAAAGFPTSCETCHKFTDTSWAQGVFNHSTFALAGVHASQPCASCHRNGVYRGTPRSCSGCHQTEFNATRNPNHAAAGFPTSCETCHRYTDTSWNQGVFNHNTFALAGVHGTQPCASCHRNGVYRGTPRACSGCHQSEYNATRNPSHAAAGFPTSCETCHKFTDTSWNQGVFNHNTFALAGVHATQPCASCHRNGVYRGTPRSCSGCHQSEYNATRDPNHLAAGFPTTCDTCHRYTDTSWSQGRFNHTWFPITTGKHAGRACSDCHTAPSAFQVFSCTTNCHGRAETDGHHREVSGYRFDSLACYSCHPQGRTP